MLRQKLHLGLVVQALDSSRVRNLLLRSLLMDGLCVFSLLRLQLLLAALLECLRCHQLIACLYSQFVVLSYLLFVVPAGVAIAPRSGHVGLCFLQMM